MTIKDLARETGYSVGTISRVLNGQPNVSEKARKTILAYVEKCGFQPNANAKYLKQQYGDGILAVVTGTSNGLFANMIEHIQRELASTRYPLMVDYVEETGDAVQRAYQLTMEKKPLGILFLGGDARLFERSFEHISLPCVLLTADASALNFPNLSSVTTDDLSAARCAVSYLFEMGHRNIGIISGDLGCYGPSRMRYDGCRLAYADHDVHFDDSCCVQAKYSFSDGYAAVFDGEKWGYIDESGNTALAHIYDYAADFSDGYAAVAADGVYSLIDHEGKALVIHREGELPDPSVEEESPEQEEPKPARGGLNIGALIVLVITFALIIFIAGVSLIRSVNIRRRRQARRKKEISFPVDDDNP